MMPGCGAYRWTGRPPPGAHTPAYSRGRSGAPGAAGIGPVPRHRYCAPTRASNPGVGGGWRKDARKPEEHSFSLSQGTWVWAGTRFLASKLLSEATERSPPRGRNPSSSPSGSGDRSTGGPPRIPCRSPRAHLAGCCGQNYLRVAGSSLPLTDTPTSPSTLEGTAPSDLETSEAGQETLSSFPHARSLIRSWQKSSCASHALPSSRVSERITSIPPTSQDGCAHSFIIHSVNYFLLSTYYVPDTVLPQMM
ncbi:uncharacterized protein LOC116456285 [Hylobates moloch]|uniref:uncharacterized protein LOC116456285 n=1 Tax=Hylobates moloch TaxID=81572 RepID=UPI0026767842|nr:uncharacterized protein LOC116456285 [Hylobates moloch]